MRVYWQAFSLVTHIFYIICVWETHPQLLVMWNKVFYCCQNLADLPVLSFTVHRRLFLTQQLFLWRILQKNFVLSWCAGCASIFSEIWKMFSSSFQSLAFAMFFLCRAVSECEWSMCICQCMFINMCARMCATYEVGLPLHTTEIFHHMKANRGWYVCRASRFHLSCPLKLVGPCIQQHLVPIWSQAEGWVPHCAAENTAYCTFK